MSKFTLLVKPSQFFSIVAVNATFNSLQFYLGYLLVVEGEWLLSQFLQESIFLVKALILIVREVAHQEPSLIVSGVQKYLRCSWG